MTEPARERRVDWIASLVLVAIVLVLVEWPIVTGTLGPKAYDHRFFHLPLIREWAKTWPVVDVRDYNSATGPLYHWIMAGVVRVIGADGGGQTAPKLQFVNTLFGALVVVVVFRFARTCLSARHAFIAALGLAFSPYLLGDAIWLMTDNLSLALIALTVGSAAFVTPTPRRTLIQGVLAALAVATRQINIWLAAPLGIAALMRGTVATTAAALVLPVATLVTFVLLWKGFVPPKFREFHTGGLQPAAFGFALTLVAAYGACLLPLVPRGLATLWAKPALLAGTLFLGALVGAVGASNAALDAGRDGGWVWRAVAQLPVVEHRSLFIVVGAALGLTFLVALFIEARRAARANEALVILAAFAAFLAAHVANARIYQRYYDPMILLTLIWLAALTVPRDEPPRRATTVAFALLATQQAVFAALALFWPML